jgi:hypothetical protein
MDNNQLRQNVELIFDKAYKAGGFQMTEIPAVLETKRVLMELINQRVDINQMEVVHENVSNATDDPIDD